MPWVVAAQLALQYGPGFVSQLIALFEKGTPTQADWDTLWSKVDNKIVTPADMPANSPTV